MQEIQNQLRTWSEKRNEMSNYLEVQTRVLTELSNTVTVNELPKSSSFMDSAGAGLAFQQAEAQTLASGVMPSQMANDMTPLQQVQQLSSMSPTTMDGADGMRAPMEGNAGDSIDSSLAAGFVSLCPVSSIGTDAISNLTGDDVTPF